MMSNKRKRVLQVSTERSPASQPKYPKIKHSTTKPQRHQYFNPYVQHANFYPGDVEFSKEIVRILRHGKYKKLQVDSEGYIDVDSILNDRKFINACGYRTLDDVHHIVSSNNKKRFELKYVDGIWKIKATQGHTINVQNLELRPINSQEFPLIYHGTYFDAWEEIKVTGLSRMKRNHIHFATAMPGQRKVTSGMRNDSEIVIVVDTEKAMKEGLHFFISSNGVILCEGDRNGVIHPKVFHEVKSLYSDEKLEFMVPEDFQDEPECSTHYRRRGTVSGQSRHTKRFRDETESSSRQQLHNYAYHGRPPNIPPANKRRDRRWEQLKDNQRRTHGGRYGQSHR